MSLVTESDAEMTFMELRAPTHELSLIVRINFELSSGHKMVIDGIDGIAAVCRNHLQKDLHTGTLFLFRNHLKCSIRILVYDGQGF
jgi:hypothetical protein